MDDVVYLLLEEPFQVKHLEHLEDLAIASSPHGTNKVLNVLRDLHDHLSGKHKGIKLSTKFDGSPAIVAGHHPVNGKFFVATKSIFNKTPKINYSHEDIKNNHGTSHTLAAKLKKALEHLPKVMPPRGVYQGDLMYDEGDKQEKKQHYEFTPNTITYKVPKNSPHGQRMKDAKLGIVFHTKYSGDDISNMSATSDFDHDNFKLHPDVHVIDPTVHGKVDYSPKDQKAFMSAFKKAAQKNADMSKGGGTGISTGYPALEGQEDSVKSYVNHTVREGKDPSIAGYLVYIKQQEIRAVDKVKTPAYKQLKKDHFDTLMQRVVADADSIGKFFELHGHLQDAKHAAMKSLNNSSPFEHSINGKKSDPEGFVMSHQGQMIKMVNRKNFSKSNFELNAKANPADNPIVFAYGRMNPPTAGHAKLVNTVQDMARRRDAGHLIVLSPSQDPEKNPLAPEQKLNYAKKLFPGANVSVAKPEQSSIIDQLKALEAKGHKHVVLVAGGDKVAEYKKLINKYNGSEFSIPRIEVVSSGDRDEKDDGVEGISGTKMRQYVQKGDFSGFVKGLPKSTKAKDAALMFKDVRKQIQGSPLIDAKTPGITLARWGKRPKKDALGEKARNEIERRKRLGLWTNVT